MQAVLHSQAACAFCPAERRASWTARPASPKDWRSLCRDRCFPPAKTSVPMLEDGSPVPGRPYPVLRFSHEPGRKTCFPPRKRTAWRARYSPGPAGHPPRKRTAPKKSACVKDRKAPKFLVRPARFELTAFCSGGKRSIQLS